MPKAKELKEKEPVELQNKRRQEESQSPLQDSRPKLEEVREWFRIEDGKTVFLEKVYAELIRRALKVHIADIDHKIKSSLQCPIRCPKKRITQYSTAYSGLGMTPYQPVPLWRPSYKRPYSGAVFGRAEEVARRREVMGDIGETPVRDSAGADHLDPAPRLQTPANVRKRALTLLLVL